MKNDLVKWVSVIIVIVTAIIAQVKENVSKEERIKRVEEILIKQSERDSKIDTFITQQMIFNAQQKIYNDSILKFIEDHE